MDSRASNVSGVTTLAKRNWAFRMDSSFEFLDGTAIEIVDKKTVLATGTVFYLPWIRVESKMSALTHRAGLIAASASVSVHNYFRIGCSTPNFHRKI